MKRDPADKARRLQAKLLGQHVENARAIIRTLRSRELTASECKRFAKSIEALRRACPGLRKGATP